MFAMWRGGFVLVAVLRFSSCDEDISTSQRSATRAEEAHRVVLKELQTSFEARADHDKQRDAALALARYSAALDGFLPALNEPFSKKKRDVATAAEQEAERKLDVAQADAKNAVLAAHAALDAAMVESHREKLREFVKHTGDVLTVNVVFTDERGTVGGPADDNELPLLRELTKLCATQGELELHMTVPSRLNPQDERDIRRSAERIADTMAGPQKVSLKNFENDQLKRREAIEQAMPAADEAARQVVPSHERAKTRLAKLVQELGVENRMRTELVENDEERPMTLSVVVKTPCAVP
jgi:hypothetical protein